MAVIRAEWLTKIYPGGVTGLRSLDVTIGSGEMVGLLGRSGSGKTTLFRLLGGALQPSGGRLEVLGCEMHQMRPAALRQLRRRMGIVYQQHNLVPRLTAAQNVLLASFGRMPFWRAALGLIHQSESQRRAAFEVLEELEIGDKLYARADDLSGGQQQRVAVARALLHTPELLLADEPIASVDAETAELILGLFRRLNRERGVTVVVSLHQSEFARRYCSRVLVLKEGELTYDGPPSGIELHRLGEEGGLRERMGGRTGPPAGMQAGAASLFGGRV